MSPAIGTYNTMLTLGHQHLFDEVTICCWAKRRMPSSTAPPEEHPDGFSPFAPAAPYEPRCRALRRLLPGGHGTGAGAHTPHAGYSLWNGLLAKTRSVSP